MSTRRSGGLTGAFQINALTTGNQMSMGLTQIDTNF